MAWRPLFRRRTLSAVDARAGFLDRPVLVVLAVSLGLIVVVFAAMLLGVL